MTQTILEDPMTHKPKWYSIFVKAEGEDWQKVATVKSEGLANVVMATLEKHYPRVIWAPGKSAKYPTWRPSS